RRGAAGRPRRPRGPADAARLGPRLRARASRRERGARGAAPRGRPPRHVPLRRRHGLPADALRARPQAPDGAARSPRHVLARDQARDHGAAPEADARRGGRRVSAGRGLALFDLDGTLLPIDSDHAWGEFMIALGWVDAASFRSGNDAFYAQYRAGALDIDAYIDFATAPLRAQDAAACAQAHRRFMREVIAPALRPAAKELVEAHR